MDSRYSRQKQIVSFGDKGQEALQKANVLVIGCGGLGCPVALYLTRAGVLNVGLVDGDIVQLSNLHRQVLFNEKDVGIAKVRAAKTALLLGNSALKIETFETRLNASNYKEIFAPYDLVIDCTDNFDSRYLINDACVLSHKPLVYGAANQLEGQVAVFNYNDSGNLRDLFPEVPKPGTIQNCEEAGVLGVITGIIGDLMALEAIKVITGIGEPLTNKLLQFDGFTSQLYTLNYKPNPTEGLPVIKDMVTQISWSEYHSENKHFQLVDVRTTKEREEQHNGGLHLPLLELHSRYSELKRYEQIAFYCKTGQRAIQAVNTYCGLKENANCVAIAIVGEI